VLGPDNRPWPFVTMIKKILYPERKVVAALRIR